MAVVIIAILVLSVVAFCVMYKMRKLPEHVLAKVDEIASEVMSKLSRKQNDDEKSDSDPDAVYI